jgi:hypothetical protein
MKLVGISTCSVFATLPFWLSFRQRVSYASFDRSHNLRGFESSLPNLLVHAGFFLSKLFKPVQPEAPPQQAHSGWRMVQSASFNIHVANFTTRPPEQRLSGVRNPFTGDLYSTFCHTHLTNCAQLLLKRRSPGIYRLVVGTYQTRSEASKPEGVQVSPYLCRPWSKLSCC